MAHRRDCCSSRWFHIALRTLHLAGVVLVGVAIFEQRAFSTAGGALMLLTGFALYAIDLRKHPGLWKEIAGLLIPLKLVLLLAMLLVPDIALALFWLVLALSSVVAHAPRAFRHARIIA